MNDEPLSLKFPLLVLLSPGSSTPLTVRDSDRVALAVFRNKAACTKFTSALCASQDSTVSAFTKAELLRRLTDRMLDGIVVDHVPGKTLDIIDRARVLEILGGP